jgi:hypothetical protein
MSYDEGCVSNKYDICNDANNGSLRKCALQFIAFYMSLSFKQKPKIYETLNISYTS